MDWIEATDTPSCFVKWLDKIERQQCLLGGGKDCGS